MENIIYIVLAIVWVIVQLAARGARKNKPPAPSSPPLFGGGAPDDSDKARPPALNPEEELRRFLRELSGAPAEPRPAAAPPPPPPPPPVTPAASPAAMPMATPRGMAQKLRERRRTRMAASPGPAPAPATPSAKAPAASASEAPPTVTILEDRLAPAIGNAPMAMPSIPMAPALAIRSVTFSAGGPSRVRRRTALPRSRGALRQAVMYQAVLGPPRALQPYGAKEFIG